MTTTVPRGKVWACRLASINSSNAKGCLLRMLITYRDIRPSVVTHSAPNLFVYATRESPSTEEGVAASVGGALTHQPIPSEALQLLEVAFATFKKPSREPIHTERT